MSHRGKEEGGREEIVIVLWGLRKPGMEQRVGRVLCEWVAGEPGGWGGVRGAVGVGGGQVRAATRSHWGA